MVYMVVGKGGGEGEGKLYAWCGLTVVRTRMEGGGRCGCRGLER